MDGLACEFFHDGEIFEDARLDARLRATFEDMAKRPAGTLPKKLVGRRQLIGGYRMFNNGKVEHGKILGAHQGRAVELLKGHRGDLLMLHDTTVLDYSGLDVKGLGQVGDGNGKGLYAHNSLAVIPGTRQVIGLMNQVLHKRVKAPKKEKRAARLARSDRESRLWTEAVKALPAMPEGVNVIDISDRGSDITEYIDFEVNSKRQFIVRSMHNRKLADEEGEALALKLHALARELSPAVVRTVNVPCNAGGYRRSQIGIAFAQVNVLPPRQPRGEHGSEPLPMWVVIARETSRPEDGENRTEWILLTNRPVESIEQAEQAVNYYACRWMVEDYHKAMKTGCGIEELQMTTRHGLDNAIALLSVLAVFVLTLRCKARDERTREQPARLDEDPIRVQLVARHMKHPNWREMTVWEYYVGVARLGGYVLNPKKRPPGWLVLWRGYMRLEDMCEGVRAMTNGCVQT